MFGFLELFTDEDDTETYEKQSLFLNFSDINRDILKYCVGCRVMWNECSIFSHKQALDTIFSSHYGTFTDE